MKISVCYVCGAVAALSPRSRCVTCEYTRSVANEQENEELRKQITILTDTVGHA